MDCGGNGEISGQQVVKVDPAIVASSPYRSQGAKDVGKRAKGGLRYQVSQITASMSGGVIDASASRNRRGVFQEIK